MKRGFRKWLINSVLGIMLAVLILAVATFSPSVDLMARMIHVESDIRLADVIVVLSSAEVKDCEHHLGLLKREESGVRLLRQGLSKSRKIIFTGGYVDESDPKQMGLTACRKKLAREMGIPQKSLIIENRATSTHENAVNTKKIMQTHEWRDALMVTDDTHAFRALKTFEKQGIRAYPATIPYMAWRNPEDGWFGHTRLTYLRQFLYEYVALALYKCYGYI